MVVVADAGMLSAANLTAIDEAGLRFIVGSRVTKAPLDLAKHFRWHGNAFTDGQIIDTITMRRTAPDPQRITTRAEPVWNPAEHPKAWRAIWQYPRKRAVRDRHTLTEQLKRAQAVVDGDKPAKKVRFVKTTGQRATLDEASLERAEVLVVLKGVLRSKSPGLVQQEIWGHLCCDYSIRTRVMGSGRRSFGVGLGSLDGVPGTRRRDVASGGR